MKSSTVVSVFLYCFWSSVSHGVLAPHSSSTNQGKGLIRKELEFIPGRINHREREITSNVHHFDQRDGRRLLSYDMRSIRHWVSAHNEERRLLFPDGELSWDASLAKFAQRHADSIGHNINCSPEFNEDNEEYGENLFWGVYEHGQNGWSVREVVEYWIKQKERYSYEENKCEVDKDENCAAYLQVVWRNTTRLGCGEVFCPYHGEFKGVAQFFVCNYFPSATLKVGHPKPF